jgi:8-oxo-dGTP pyrophosphatase MutT (NUDIX family)
MGAPSKVTMTPEILSQDNLFDFRTTLDQGKPLKFGLHIFRRVVQVGKNRINWIFASRNDTPSEVPVNAVVIIAKVGDKVVITKEVRYPLCGLPGSGILRHEWGFPAGLLEEGEDPLMTGVRELFEETGLRAKFVYPTLTTGKMISSAGAMDECVKMVFIEAEGEISNEGNELGEVIETNLMDLAGVSKLLDDSFRDPSILISGKAYGFMYAWWLAGKIAIEPAGHRGKVPTSRVDWSGDKFTIHLMTQAS